MKGKIILPEEVMSYGDLYAYHRYYQTMLGPELGFLLKPTLEAFYTKYNAKINLVVERRMELQRAWLVMDETKENKVPKIDEETKDIIMQEGKLLADYKAAHKELMQTEFNNGAGKLSKVPKS